jgi:hypothetical protein
MNRASERSWRGQSIAGIVVALSIAGVAAMTAPAIAS